MWANVFISVLLHVDFSVGAILHGAVGPAIEGDP